MNNLLTDIAGVRVGHADDPTIGSGVTAIIFDEPAVASIDVRGGGPATRDTQLLEPGNTVEAIHGITLSGGSAYGLDSGGGVMAWLAEQGRGFAVGTALVPLAPTAVVFDLMNGGNKNWGRFAPYRELGYAAAASATDGRFALGSVGAGMGATTAGFKGGTGSASAKTSSGVTVAALAVANAAGSVVVGDGPWFWAAPLELDGEFGGRGHPPAFTPAMHELRFKGGARITPLEATTLAVVVTDAQLSKNQAKRLAIIASSGFARAIYPVHAPLDGDLVFAAATGRKAVDGPANMTELGMVAANVVSRAIARGVYEAGALPFPGSPPAWKDRFAR
jgi:L-aminopeptidase/D-esterase-like protein